MYWNYVPQLLLHQTAIVTMYMRLHLACLMPTLVNRWPGTGGNFCLGVMSTLTKIGNFPLTQIFAEAFHLVGHKFCFLSTIMILGTFLKSA